jgi:pimeloyl-ACP methyl ester carboxylesterase
MDRYLLLHGSWHGAWCWYKVAPQLRAFGEVIVPNLPGRGRDPALLPLVTVGRMVRMLARQLHPSHPTTIVAHSRYGVLATAFAEAYPAAVRRIIYLASFMLPTGERVLDHFQTDTDSLLQSHVEVSRVGLWDRLAPAAYVPALYADCSAEDVALATALLCKEPSLPALARVTTSAQRWGRVPKAYIRLTQDRAVSLRLQDRLIELGKLDRVESLHASHSVYFSQPEALVASIRRLDSV